MKNRTVILTVEVETNKTLKQIKNQLTSFLFVSGYQVKQTQMNVIKKTKTN